MSYYNKIKEELIKNEVYKKVKDYSKNRNDLMTYYNVGKLLVEAQGGEKRAKYGDGLIKEYSRKLTDELGKGYSIRNLKNMRKFYLFQKGQAMPAQLTWSHIVELLRLKNSHEIDYYKYISAQRNLSYRELANLIKTDEYGRLDDKTKQKLIRKEKLNALDEIKNPIVITNNDYIHLDERALKTLILENIPSFLSQLGDGFCFIKDEYKIKLGNTYNYIDLLLFNIKFNCYVVVELKVTEVKKEHFGQIQMYMNYVDEHIKTFSQDKTIGIIICEVNNKLVVRYCSNHNVFVTTYQLRV